MRKIPTVFKRDPDNPKRVLNEVTPGCEWVLTGEGVATRKYEGTCCLVRDGLFYKRRETKPGGAAPADFELVEVDQNTGKGVGWVPVTDDPENRWHWEGWDRWTASGEIPPDGTYELCGPKVQGNPERFDAHSLVPHGAIKLNAPSDFAGLAAYLARHSFEGIVWHHPDGRMAKLKKRDFPAEVVS